MSILQISYLKYINIEMINAPNIKPIRVKEFETKQSKYPHCGKLPIRSVILGPSGSGKPYSYLI